MKKPTIIGLIGKKRVGKDTFCQTIQGVRFAFADAVKDSLCELKGISLVDIEANKERWRADLQAIGTDGRRKDKSMWIDKIRKKLQLHMRTDSGMVICITDVRYRNEAHFVQRLGGKLVKIVRPNVADGDQHESETEQDTISADVVITNNGTLEDFKTNCWTALEWLRKI